MAEVITELCSKSGVYFNTDFLFDPSGEKIFDELYILNVFADIIDLRRSFVVQNLEANAVKVSEVTKLVEAANKITEILEEQTEEYPFTTQYLFNYLLHQKPKG